MKGNRHGHVPPKNSMNSGVSIRPEALEGSDEETGRCTEVIAGIISSSASPGRCSVGVASGTELSTVSKDSGFVGGTSLVTGGEGAGAGTVVGSAVDAWVEAGRADPPKSCE